MLGNRSPDYEGIFFRMEDDSIHRIGLDEAGTPSLSDFTMLERRLIGFSAKFFSNIEWSLYAPGDIGLIMDSTNCEAAQFTWPVSFSTMTADVSTGVSV